MPTLLVVATIWEDDKPFYKVNDIAKVLGIGNIREYQRLIKRNTNGGNQSMIFLTKDAVLHLISRSRSYRSKELGVQFGMRCIEVVCPSIEAHTLCQLQRAFYGQTMETQYSVNGKKKYRIDLYFPVHRIAVECDETYHLKPKNKDTDGEREKEIKGLLDCTFIRYNPFVCHIASTSSSERKGKHGASEPTSVPSLNCDQGNQDADQITITRDRRRQEQFLFVNASPPAESFSRLRAGDRTIADDPQQTILERCDARVINMLRRFPDKLVMGGGAVLGAVAADAPVASETSYSSSGNDGKRTIVTRGTDYDLYLSGVEDEEDANSVAREILDMSGCYDMFWRTGNAITMLLPPPRSVSHCGGDDGYKNRCTQPQEVGGEDWAHRDDQEENNVVVQLILMLYPTRAHIASSLKP